MDIVKLSATVRRVAAEQPMYRLETKKDLIAAADVLDQLIGPDPKAASTNEASFPRQPGENSLGATAGPGPTFKFKADASESERTPINAADPIQVILRMEDSPYQV